MYKIAFFVPKSEKERVKNALFLAGAGKYKNYDLCSWEVEGAGQFRPLSGSKPFLRNLGELANVKEYRVEMICEDHLLRDVLEKLLEEHPYEEPAYEAWRVETLSTL